jgi:hypothetical protein
MRSHSLSQSSVHSTRRRRRYHHATRYLTPHTNVMSDVHTHVYYDQRLTGRVLLLLYCSVDSCVSHCLHIMVHRSPRGVTSI